MRRWKRNARDRNLLALRGGSKIAKHTPCEMRQTFKADSKLVVKVRSMFCLCPAVVRVGEEYECMVFYVVANTAAVMELLSHVEFCQHLSSFD